MPKLLSIGAAFAFLFFHTITFSQVPVQSLPTMDTIDFAMERAQIPGETMGQKLESLLYWSVAEKERRFPQMHQIFPSIEVEAGDAVYPLEMGEPIQPKLPDGSSVASYMERNNIGGLIVLGAVYMLYAYQRVLLGPDRQLEVADADGEEHFFLVPLIAITFLVGVFPNVVLHLVDGPVGHLLNTFTPLP